MTRIAKHTSSQFCYPAVYPSTVTVTAGLPRGQYEFSCRFLDPTTGRLLMEDRNFFDLQ